MSLGNTKRKPKKSNQDKMK